MFLKSLIISTDDTVIRTINFRNGINLIVDESVGKITGNNVGKTTVLKLIDFCFGADRKIIWEDPESKRQDYQLVKDFLIDNEVLITLILTDSFDNRNARDVKIERNFINRGKKVVRRINGENILKDDFDDTLKNIFFPDLIERKPTFRQIISHNIRYEHLSLTNTLRTLHRYTSDVEYETLHLFMLGCNFDHGIRKIEISERVGKEKSYKERLEKEQTRSGYEATLSLINNEIDELNQKRDSLNINENFKEDLELLNQKKYEINKLSSTINKLNMRRDLIIESKEELEEGLSNIDLRQLQVLYQQTGKYYPSIQKSFEDLVDFHNNMIAEKVRFISNELPTVERNLDDKQKVLEELLNEEVKLTEKISKSSTFDELEELIIQLNNKHEQKGEIETIISQLRSVEDNLKTLNTELEEIDELLFSDEFEEKVQKQVDKFNKHFTSVSEVLYNERFALKKDVITNQKGQKLYKFSTFSPFGPNVASGKKQGEISSFDIAYIDFATEEKMPCLNFILNDKKELMHDNQLVKIASLVNENTNVQFVASILRDKLPEELNKEEYFILKLSENKKLFKIENLSPALQ